MLWTMVFLLILLDEREAGDAVQRIRLDLQSPIGNVRVTPPASAILAGVYQVQGGFDAAELVERPDLYFHGKTPVELNGSLIDGVGVQLGFHIGVL
jgi:hypothetical protein